MNSKNIVLFKIIYLSQILIKKSNVLKEIQVTCNKMNDFEYPYSLHHICTRNL
jgi:hypothetical protein